MFNSKNWRFGTSLLLTLGMTLGTATPGLMSKRAMAQFYGQGQYRGNQQPQYPSNRQLQYRGNQQPQYPSNRQLQYRGNQQPQYPSGRQPQYHRGNQQTQYPSNRQLQYRVNQQRQYPSNRQPQYHRGYQQLQYRGNRQPQYHQGQRRGPSSVARIPAGTLIPIEYEKAEKVVVTPDESMRLRLTVTRDIRDFQGRVVIPFGSQIEGELRPVTNGTQFFAEQLIIGDRRRFPINAISGVVTDTEEITKGASAGNILKGAAVGGGAAALLSAVLGDKVLATERILIGAGLGALGGVLLGREEGEVFVIYPEDDLGLRLRSDFMLR